MKQSLRTISRMLCVIILLTIVLSVSYITHFTDHECIGNDCEICYHIQICEQTLKKLAAGAAALAGIAASRIVFVLIPVLLLTVCFSNTLIRMKVKLSC